MLNAEQSRDMALRNPLDLLRLTHNNPYFNWIKTRSQLLSIQTTLSKGSWNTRNYFAKMFKKQFILNMAKRYSILSNDRNVRRARVAAF